MPWKSFIFVSDARSPFTSSATIRCPPRTTLSSCSETSSHDPFSTHSASIASPSPFCRRSLHIFVASCARAPFQSPTYHQHRSAARCAISRGFTQLPKHSTNDPSSIVVSHRNSRAHHAIIPRPRQSGCGKSSCSAKRLAQSELGMVTRARSDHRQ